MLSEGLGLVKLCPYNRVTTFERATAAAPYQGDVGRRGWLILPKALSHVNLKLNQGWMSQNIVQLLDECGNIRCKKAELIGKVMIGKVEVQCTSFV